MTELLDLAGLRVMAFPGVDKKYQALHKEAGAFASASLTDFQRQIIELIGANPSISYDEVANLSGKDKAMVRRNIQRLKQSGRLERVGSKKTGYWRVLQ